jgi:dipeptidyl-peptidase-4
VTRLSVERLFSSPSLNGSVPIQVRFSPDGTRVAYLANPPEDRERLDLYYYDIESGDARRLIDSGRLAATAAPTEAELAERERRRQFATGVSTYRWLPDSQRLCCLIDGAVHVVDATSGAARVVTPTGTRQTDIAVSGLGRHVSYVRDGDLYVHDLDLGREVRMTNDASECVTNGIAEFVAQEEMHRFEGHWWSPDDRQLVFARVDTSVIPVTQRYEFTADELVARPQRYPHAGAANARVDLGVIEINTRSQRWIDYRHRPDDYLARVAVSKDEVVVQSQSRDQRTLEVTAYPFEPGNPRVLATERQPAWVNLHNNFRFIGAAGDFVWTSEQAGSSQLYLHRRDASALALSGDNGRINEVVHADAMQAYVLGWVDDPTEQHLFRIKYDAPGVLERLTPDPGWHEASIDAAGAWFVDRYSHLLQPPCIALRSLKNESPPRPLAANGLIEGHPYHAYLPRHSTATFGRIAADDGQELFYRLTLPPAHDATRPLPVLVNVYGGPGVQRVRNEWAPLTNQLFANAGVAVFELDNRGGANRAKAFEDPIRGRLAAVEVADQLAGIRWLRSQPWVDGERIGVIGHSYGGFMALMLLARSDGMIRAGVSTAPVVDWRLYDTHYTERYLDTPENNADGYRDSCVLTYVESMRGELLLMHGMADDNVLLANTTMLMKALQDRGRRFELMLYPGAKHALQERTVAIHRYDTILDFLTRKLLA